MVVSQSVLEAIKEVACPCFCKQHPKYHIFIFFVSIMYTKLITGEKAKYAKHQLFPVLEIMLAQSLFLLHVSTIVVLLIPKLAQL